MRRGYILVTVTRKLALDDHQEARVEVRACNNSGHQVLGRIKHEHGGPFGRGSTKFRVDPHKCAEENYSGRASRTTGDYRFRVRNTGDSGNYSTSIFRIGVIGPNRPVAADDAGISAGSVLQIGDSP